MQFRCCSTGNVAFRSTNMESLMSRVIKPLLVLIMGLLLQFAASTAKAELREGPACSLPSIPAGGGPPPDCGKMRYVMVSYEVPGLGGGVSANTPDPECGAALNSPSAAATAVGAFAAAYSGNPNVGLAVASLGDQVAQGLVPNNKLFHQKTRFANCTAIVTIVPAIATIRGYRVVADSLAAGPAECRPGTDCPKGWSKFMYYPVDSKKDSIQYVTVEYMNWASYSQTGRLIIFYEMPVGSKPPIPMM